MQLITNQVQTIITKLKKNILFNNLLIHFSLQKT